MQDVEIEWFTSISGWLAVPSGKGKCNQRLRELLIIFNILGTGDFRILPPYIALYIEDDPGLPSIHKIQLIFAARFLAAKMSTTTETEAQPR